MSYSSLNNAIAGIPGPDSFRNKIINGNFFSGGWQRGTSLSAASSLRMLADRWWTGAVGATIAPSQVAFTVGQTSVPYEPTFHHRAVVVAGSADGDYAYQYLRIEDVRTLAGQTTTLSFYAKADANKNIAFYLAQTFGGAEATVYLSPVTCALTSTWQKFTVTISMPSIAGKTITGNGYLQFVIWYDAGTTFNSYTNSLGHQSGTFDIAQVQLEAGSIATPFEQRPYTVELALCQRHCYRRDFSGTQTVGFGISASATAAWIDITLPVCMYASPALSFSGDMWVSNLVDATGALETPYLTMSQCIPPYNKVLLITKNANFAAKQPCCLNGNTAAAGSYIMFTAEI